jgi:hypothetical protein
MRTSRRSPDSIGRRHWGAGEDHVPGQQRHVGGDEADQVKAVEDQLAGVGVLPELAVLEQLDGQIMRVDLRLHVRPERRKGVERLRPRPLALGVLNRAVADVLRRGVPEDVAGAAAGVTLRTRRPMTMASSASKSTRCVETESRSLPRRESTRSAPSARTSGSFGTGLPDSRA